jgi:hypothetical protein
MLSNTTNCIKITSKKVINKIRNSAFHYEGCRI